MNTATVVGRAARQVALLILALPLAGCAVIAHTAMQSVPVTSRPAGAEVFVNGELRGVTPLVLELHRGQPYELSLRHGGQERTVILENVVEGGYIALDAAPAAIVGTLTVIGCLSGSGGSRGGWGPDLSGLQATFCAIGLLVTAASATPIIVDGATGAWHELTPTEVEVVF